MTNIVIVGAGQAGGSAALQLRSAGFEGALTLIGAEPHPPYERPPLSKAYLMGDLAYDSLLLRPSEFYRDQNVQLLTDTSVTSINLVEKTVMGKCFEDRQSFGIFCCILGCVNHAFLLLIR